MRQQIWGEMVNLIRPFLQFISEFDSESIIKIGPYVAIVKNKCHLFYWPPVQNDYYRVVRLQNTPRTLYKSEPIQSLAQINCRERYLWANFDSDRRRRTFTPKVLIFGSSCNEPITHLVETNMHCSDVKKKWLDEGSVSSIFFEKFPTWAQPDSENCILRSSFKV